MDAAQSPRARLARMPLAASAGAPSRPRTSGAMRSTLLLRHTTRNRRHAREQSRLCSCAKEVLRTPRHCQVVGITRGEASLVDREHQCHQPHAPRPPEGSAGHVDEGLAGAPPSVCSRATRIGVAKQNFSDGSHHTTSMQQGQLLLLVTSSYVSASGSGPLGRCTQNACRRFAPI